jgi:ankyrin repeat protein
MKKQNKFLHRTSIVFILLGTLLCFTGCQQGNAQKDSHQSDAKNTPPAVDIHTAVLTGNIAALKQHIAAGSNLNEKDPIGGSSPLITACLFGKTEMAKLLMDAGVELNFKNNDGSTPLHTAAFFCRPEIVQLLLAKGANKTIKNKYGQTAHETVAGAFASVKNVYESIGKMLAPMGLKLDNVYLEKTRPQIAAMLR